MSIQSVSSVNIVSFKGKHAKSKNVSTTQPQNNIKNSKALDAVTVAGVAIYKNRQINFNGRMALNKAGKTVKQTAGKLSGNADERLAGLKNVERYSNMIKNLTPEELEAFKKLNPEILEQIGDWALTRALSLGDVDKITTSLNSVSVETLKALNDVGVETDTIVHGLVLAGKNPTAEGVTKLGSDMQKALEEHESQFKRVELLDKIFTPDGIRSLKGTNNAVCLRIWLAGNVANMPFGKADNQFLKCCRGALNSEYKADDFISKIMQLAQQL